MVTKPDYQLKSDVLKSGLPKLQRQVSRAIFLGNNRNEETPEGVYTLHDALTINANMVESNPLYWNESRKINQATYKRTERLRDKIESMFALQAFDNDLKLIFMTFTFNDKALETKQETRRTYVARYLKENSPLDYIANIDFGSDKEYIDHKGNIRKGTKREHYHAIALVRNKYSCTKWANGSVDFETVRKNSSPTALGKYVSKLTNHAIKESTKRQALIYCRNSQFEL